MPKTPETFGAFFRARRQALGMSLKGFCLRHKFDPGNISKLERGRLAPPISKAKLENYARALELAPGSSDWSDFVDLAHAATGRIPDELLKDTRVLNSLPLLYRSLRGDDRSKKQLAGLLKHWRS